MKFLITGATGLVGTALSQRAAEQGHEVTALTRRPRNDSDIEWDPATGRIDADRLTDLDVVIHLAGDSIATGRWNAAKKNQIRDSRVKGTELLCDTLTKLDNRPQLLISASAIGYYGDRGDTVLDESSSAGSLFLSGVCQAWEAATTSALTAGIRVINARLGVVLSTKGGALKQMLTPFRMGAGGIVGNGRQYWSWIALDDVANAMLHCVRSESLSGPVNFVAPDPVTNRDFTKALGKALRRPTIVPMPRFAAKLALGEMADELLLASTRVVPTKLKQSGYDFSHTDLGATLSSLIHG